jgi:YD repeat-containing protein
MPYSGLKWLTATDYESGMYYHYTYDVIGNLLSDGTNTYTYNSANRMTHRVNSKDDISYTYNGQGDRISQENNDVINYFLGNVRQLVSDKAPDTKVTISREYSPYGEVVSHLGTGKTGYGFTGELQDGDLVHLRARDYAVLLVCTPFAHQLFDNQTLRGFIHFNWRI